jgi:hypothetical protein
VVWEGGMLSDGVVMLGEWAAMEVSADTGDLVKMVALWGNRQYMHP